MRNYLISKWLYVNLQVNKNKGETYILGSKCLLGKDHLERMICNSRCIMQIIGVIKIVLRQHQRSYHWGDVPNTNILHFYPFFKHPFLSLNFFFSLLTTFCGFTFGFIYYWSTKEASKEMDEKERNSYNFPIIIHRWNKTTGEEAKLAICKVTNKFSNRYTQV